MPNEDWKLGRDIGRIVGLGLVGVIAGLFLDLGRCDGRQEGIFADPVACLLESDRDYACD